MGLYETIDQLLDGCNDSNVPEFRFVYDRTMSECVDGRFANVSSGLGAADFEEACRFLDRAMVHAREPHCIVTSFKLLVYKHRWLPTSYALVS